VAVAFLQARIVPKFSETIVHGFLSDSLAMEHPSEWRALTWSVDFQTGGCRAPEPISR
jgi:hypothetical protein